MSLRTRRPVVWVAQSFWVEPLFRGVARYAFEHGWIVDSRMSQGVAAAARPLWRPDGVIVFTGGATGLIETVKACGAPIVDIEDYADHYGAPKVIGDDLAVGEAAARHLAMDRPSLLVAVSGPNPGIVMRRRMAGFRREAAAHKLPVRTVTAAEFDPVAVTRDGPAGVFAAGDFQALDVMRRCLEAGVAVPERVAILGCDNTEAVCELAPVPLSSVDMAFEEKGRRAAESLHRLMRGESVARTPVVVPPAGVVARSSTRMLHSGHAELDRVMRHFLENARRGCGVATLCEECGVSPRTVQHLMAKHLGKSPLELLRDYRLELAGRFEASRQLTLDGVARSAGFGGRASLNRARKAVSA